MTTLSTFHCPNCEHPIFKYHVADNSAPPQAATFAPASNDAETGRDGNTCPKCGRYKSSGFDLCIDCNRQNLDICPKCGGNKQKQYPTCYKCKDQSSGGEAPSTAPNIYEGSFDDDMEDDPF